MSILKYLVAGAILAQSIPAAPAPVEDTDLKLALVFSRHGVRSPTKSNDAYNPYSLQDWPDWPVAPGFLTPHGKQLMTVFGDYYRQYFLSQGIYTGNSTTDAASTFIYADNSE